ncbi:MAG: sensor histidine kinase [Promethearchaeota archaeon]
MSEKNNSAKIKKSLIEYFNVTDINEKKIAELAMLRAHRFASIGELVSSVVHEINNPLFGILNYSALIKETIEEGKQINKESEEYEFLLGIIEESERISKIVKNLSEFANKAEEKEIYPINILSVFEKVEKLLSYSIKHVHINIKKEIDENFPEIMLQQYRIEHILFNIILNSIHALENIQNRNKEIIISAEIEKVGGKKKLNINIYDNGEGIPAENLSKIFNPFFTTRYPTKKCTGLGLYLVYDIINDLNGTIAVDSKLGEWTKLKINLPVSF